MGLGFRVCPSQSAEIFPRLLLGFFRVVSYPNAESKALNPINAKPSTLNPGS